jgi:hypothetical protein
MVAALILHMLHTHPQSGNSEHYTISDKDKQFATLQLIAGI